MLFSIHTYNISHLLSIIFISEVIHNESNILNLKNDLLHFKKREICRYIFCIKTLTLFFNVWKIEAMKKISKIKNEKYTIPGIVE